MEDVFDLILDEDDGQEIQYAVSVCGLLFDPKEEATGIETAVLAYLDEGVDEEVAA